MRICIDSCVFIRAIDEQDESALRLLRLISPQIELFVPGIVTKEVSRNLKTTEARGLFFRLFAESGFAQIMYEPVPKPLVSQYIQLGLREKGDAYIAAFSEWMSAEYLISINRHFLRELNTKAFEVLHPKEFLLRWDAGLFTNVKDATE